MYSVRLLLRPFVSEISCLNRRSAHFRVTKPTHTPPRRVNETDGLAGIRRQTEEMGYTPHESAEFDGLDDDEFNISMAEQIHDIHTSEMRRRKVKHALAVYGRIYYKHMKEPALLSSEDLKQIRHLHFEEKWPISALAKSFPASELIIKKVLKKIRNLPLEAEFKYDEDVAHNWILLRKGKLEISDELRQHCLKFTNRVARRMTSKDLSVINSKPSRPPGSFLDLIKPPKNEDNEMEDGRKGESPPDGKEEIIRDHGYSYYSGNKTLNMLRERITLEEARNRELESIADQGIGVTEDVKSFVCGQGPSKDSLPDSEGGKGTHSYTYVETTVGTKERNNQFVSKWDFSSGKSRKASRDAMMAPSVDFPEQISIPETAKKAGAIYRVEDCFYNEDGEFLYRVPGLKF